MRIFEFRGKNTYGKWVYGSLIQLVNEQPKIEFVKRTHPDDGRCVESDWCYVDPKTVGQFTGLKDKNGNKIYEGDIIHVFDPDYEYLGMGNVEYLNIWGIWYVDGEDTNDGLFDLYHQECVFEIIGNIHDNPELLK